MVRFCGRRTPPPARVLQPRLGSLKRAAHTPLLCLVEQVSSRGLLNQSIDAYQHQWKGEEAAAHAEVMFPANGRPPVIPEHGEGRLQFVALGVALAVHD